MSYDLLSTHTVHVNYKFPLATEMQMTERWIEILHKRMNTKCRNAKASMKKSGAEE